MTTRSLDDIHRVLSALEKIWQLNPHLSLSQLLEHLTPSGVTTNPRDESILREINKRLGGA